MVQIAGRIRLKLRADIAPEDLEQSCYDKCEALTSPEPTGCEFHETNRTCFAHPVEVERGDGDGGFSCWIFEIAPGDYQGLLVKIKIFIFLAVRRQPYKSSCPPLRRGYRLLSNF